VLKRNRDGPTKTARNDDDDDEEEESEEEES